MSSNRNAQRRTARTITALFSLIAVTLIQSSSGFNLQQRSPSLTKKLPHSKSHLLVPGKEQVLRIDDTSLYLDLSDILDGDTSEFLETLRRQMEGTNVLNASPREVTNRIKSFFSVSTRNNEEIQTFRKYLEANKSVLDIVNAILIVEGCSRAHMNVDKLLSWPDILDAMEKHSPLFSSSMIYRALSSIKKMDPDAESTKRFVRLTWQKVAGSTIEMDDSDLCPAIYSLQSVNANTQEVRQFVQYFADAMNNSSGEFSSKTLCSAIFGLKKMKAHNEVRSLLAALTKKVKGSESFYHPVNICIALNGLQNMDDQSVEVRELMGALMERSIPANEQGLDKAKDREISMAIFGLQRMTGAGSSTGNQKRISNNSNSGAAGAGADTAKELRLVLNYIHSLLQDYDASFEARRLGFAVMGMSNLNDNILHKEMELIVEQLGDKAKDAWGDVNSQELSMCLHGLSGMGSESIAVRRLVSALAPMVARCPRMGQSDVRSALYGLQGMHSNSAEVCQLVTSFCDLIERSDVSFSSPYDAATALYGIQGMSSSHPAARRLISLVTKMISDVKGPFEARDVAMSLYGLKECSSVNPETLALVAKLEPHIRNFKGQLTSQNVAQALCGLQKMRSGPKAVDSLLGALAPHVRSARGFFNSKGLSTSLGGLQGLNSKHAEAQELIKAMNVLLQQSLTTFEGFEDFHQVSVALSGFTGMSTDEEWVRDLLDTFVKLLTHKKNNKVADTSVNKVADTSVNKVAATLAVSSRADGRLPDQVKQDKYARMIRNQPKADKIGTALFAMQGMSSRYESVRLIMDHLLPFLEQMPAPNGKILGMALQGFRSCTGKPKGSHAEALAVLAKKMPGWSRAKGRGGVYSPAEKRVVGGGGGADAGRADFEDVQVTLRSALWGISKLDRFHPSVKAILGALARELEGWDISKLDRRTATAFSEVLKGGDLEEDESIKKLLLRAQPIIAEFKSTKQPDTTDNKRVGSNNNIGSNNSRGNNNTPRRDGSSGGRSYPSSPNQSKASSKKPLAAAALSVDHSVISVSADVINTSENSDVPPVPADAATACVIVGTGIGTATPNTMDTMEAAASLSSVSPFWPSSNASWSVGNVIRKSE